MSTARDLIQRALRTAGVLGVGQTASAGDMADALALLNDMLSQWNARRWLVYHLRDVWCAASGDPSYTVGPGGDFDIPRPNRIESVYLRLNPPTGGTPHEFNLDSASITDGSDVLAPSYAGANTIDYPLTLMESMEDYNLIALKGIQQMPSYAYYDPGFPFGRLYVWTIASSIYELHITVRAPLQQFAGLTDNVLMPPEYGEALHYNLAGRLQIAYGLQANPGIVGLARAALDTIRAANAQIPLMQMPPFIRSRLRTGGTVAAAWGIGGLGSLSGGGTVAPGSGAEFFVIGVTPVSGGVFGP